MTARDVAALRARRSELSNQLESATSRRNGLAARLEDADGVNKAGLEQRISLLEARVRSAEIVEPSADGRAGIGTLVRVRDFDAGSTHEYELVGPLESDGSGRVSVEAPVGRALVGRRPGDRLDVETPRGVLGLELLEVRPAPEATLEREAA